MIQIIRVHFYTARQNSGSPTLYTVRHIKREEYSRIFVANNKENGIFTREFFFGGDCESKFDRLINVPIKNTMYCTGYRDLS